MPSFIGPGGSGTNQKKYASFLAFAHCKRQESLVPGEGNGCAVVIGYQRSLLFHPFKFGGIYQNTA